jgi:hypothetical protein
MMQILVDKIGDRRGIARQDHLVQLKWHHVSRVLLPLIFLHWCHLPIHLSDLSNTSPHLWSTQHCISTVHLLVHWLWGRRRREKEDKHAFDQNLEHLAAAPPFHIDSICTSSRTHTPYDTSWKLPYPTLASLFLSMTVWRIPSGRDESSAPHHPLPRQGTIMSPLCLTRTLPRPPMPYNRLVRARPPRGHSDRGRRLCSQT